jgi:predicted permease
MRRLNAALRTGWRDVHAAYRSLRRRPGFVLAVVATLSLALGINAALFALVDVALLRPIPGMRDDGRLVNVHRLGRDGGELDRFSHPAFRDLREAVAHAVDLEGMHDRGFSLGGEQAELVGGQLVSGGFFDVMGVRPHHGRLLAPTDDQPSAAPVAVISHHLWRTRFASDPGVLGRELRLNGHPFTVVGVAAEGFAGHFIGFPFDLWVPLAAAAQAAPGESLVNRETTWVELVGRLRPGVEIAQARAVLDNAAHALGTHDALFRERTLLAVRPMTGLDDSLRGGVLGFVGLLQATGALVVLIACLNVGNLLLARMAGRRREVAIRVALGAGRPQLLRQLVAEALLLFLGGAAIGLLIATWAADALSSFQPPFPIALRLDLRPDLRMAAYAFAVAVAGALATGLGPAWRAARVDPAPALKDTGTLTERWRLRRVLVGAQVAGSVLLLVTSGLLLRTVQRARTTDPGFDPRGVQRVSMNVSLLSFDEARGRRFYADLLRRLESAPGVERAALSRVTPLSPGSLTTVVSAAAAAAPEVAVDWTAVTPGYFDTLRIPLVSGRGFADTDDATAPAVAIVNETMARRLWPHQPALGRALHMGTRPLTVVGIARDGRYRRIGEDPRPYLYVPSAQSYSAGMRALVRSRLPPAATAAIVEREVRALAPDLPVLDSQPLQQQMAITLFPQRVAGMVAGALGLLGLVLATVGLHGVVSYSVTARTREIGIRIALGATGLRVRRMVLGEALAPVVFGVVVGLALAAGGARLVQALLPGTGHAEPVTLAAVAAVMVLVGAGAAWRPARRAASLAPMTALREE